MGKLEYPKDLKSFRKKFSDSNSCMEYLAQCRWPDGFICPHCLGVGGWLNSKRFVYECKSCEKQTSPTAGTVMHRSHIPIEDWFWTAYLMATHTPGISATQLKRQLSFASDTTAWHMLHRLRTGMVNENRTKLAGLIEADETFIGGPAKGKKGRGVTDSNHKSLVVGAVEVVKYKSKSGEMKERAGRLRLQLIPDATEVSLGTFLMDNLESKSRVRTDGWTGYSDIAMIDFIHHVRVVGPSQLAHKKFPHIHRVFGNLKTWINGTYHGVEPKHLQSYLNEFVFRFNRRKHPMAAFQTLLGISMQKKPVSLDSLQNRSQQ